MMSKLVFIILLNFSISRNFSFGGKLCNHYDDEDCVDPNVIKNGHFVNQWSVHLPGLSKEQARRLLEDNGFEYLGKIMDGVDLHLVTKTGTPEKHAMPNKKVMELLKRHEQVNSVAQKHVIHRSPDEVYNILNEKRVYCQSLNPDEIKLNDGRDNFERIMGRKIKMEKDVESHAIKPIPNNEKEENEDNKNLPSENSKTSSELANENLMEMDLPDENLTAEDFSNEIVSMEYSPRKTSSSVRIMTKDES